MDQEFPEFSRELGEIAKALAAAQGELQDAKKDSINPHFKNKYASLASVREAITATFARHGLSVVQLNEPHGESGVCVVTLLMHTSGQWIKSRLFVPVTKKDPQGFGSALSYARRYALGAIANIATDDDDDANVASKTQPPKEAPPATTTTVNVEALIMNLETAMTAEELAKASAAVGAVKDKISKADLERCRNELDKSTRRLAGKAA